MKKQLFFLMSMTMAAGAFALQEVGSIDKCLLQSVMNGDLNLRLPRSGRKADLDRLLPIAAAKGFTPICAKLLSSGASPDAQKFGGYTALNYAVESEDIELTELLCKFGADANCGFFSKFTPLFFAIKVANHKLCSILIKYGASVNSTATVDGVKVTPLDCAVGNNDIWMCRALICAGADIPANCVGGTPEIARFLRLIRDFRAVLNGQGSFGLFFDNHLAVWVPNRKEKARDLLEFLIARFGPEAHIFKYCWQAYGQDLQAYCKSACKVVSLK